MVQKAKSIIYLGRDVCKCSALHHIAPYSFVPELFYKYTSVFESEFFKQVLQLCTTLLYLIVSRSLYLSACCLWSDFLILIEQNTLL